MSDSNSFKLFSKLGVLKFFRESLLIIFSILFALVINEYRANQKLEKEKDKIFSSIKLELESNLEALKRVQNYHMEMSETLMQLIKSENFEELTEGQTSIDIFLRYSGNRFREPRIQSNAWETAKLSGVLSNFDNDIIYELSTLYELQEEGVETVWKKTVESFFHTDSYETEKNFPVLKMLQMSTRNLAGTEHSLIDKYEYTLKYLEEN